MYVQLTNEERSWNHYCSGKAVTVTCCECAFVASSTQREMRKRHIVIGGLSGSTIFFHILS
jgi:hypothetical protein